MTIHHSRFMIEHNKRMIAIETSELCRNWALMRATPYDGMKALYRGYIRNLARNLRISRENLIRWEAL